MKNLIRGLFTFLLMFVIPYLGTLLPISLTLGYFIDSNILVGIIGSAIFFIFGSNTMIMGIFFLASVIVPIVYGDFGLMLISIIFIALFFVSPYLLVLINKGEED